MRLSIPVVLGAALLLVECDRSARHSADSARIASKHETPASSQFDVKHPDWAAFEKQLPDDPVAAAAAL